LDQNPDKKFILVEATGQSCNRKEVKDIACRFAHLFASFQVAQGDVIHCMCDNSVLLAALQLGTCFDGVVYAAHFPSSTLQEWIEQAIQLKPILLVCMNGNLKTAVRVAANCPSVRAVLVLVDNSDSDDENGHSEDQDKLGVKVLRVTEKSIKFVDAISEHVKIAKPPDESCFCILFTSGSTGKAKIVMRSHSNWLAHVSIEIESSGKPVGKRVEHGSCEFFSPAGLRQLYACLFTESVFIMDNDESMDKTIQVMAEKGCTHTTWAPTDIIRLVKRNKDDHSVLLPEALKQIRCVGAMLPPAIAKELLSQHPGIDILPVYASTEAGIICFGPALGESTGWTGMALVAGVQVKIVDLTSGKECLPGEKGEVLTRGPQNMMGYWDEDTFSKHGDRWLRTGDIGYFDSQGLLHLVARCKDVIMVATAIVSPIELENLLMQHENVAEAAVIAVFHEELNEVPKAFISLKNKDADVNEIREFVDSRVADYKRLMGGIQVLESLPHIRMGKVNKKALRDREQTYIETIEPAND
jgi:acyl-coenzyme A synthetase/AMP-(fatty) acid ligase